MNKKLQGQIEVSLGLLVGMVIMSIILKVSDGTDWTETFKDKKIITLIAGILLTVALYYWKRPKSTALDIEDEKE